MLSVMLSRKCPQQMQRSDSHGPIAVFGPHQYRVVHAKIDGRVRTQVVRIVWMILDPVQTSRQQNDHLVLFGLKAEG